MTAPAGSATPRPPAPHRWWCGASATCRRRRVGGKGYATPEEAERARAAHYYREHYLPALAPKERPDHA